MTLLNNLRKLLKVCFYLPDVFLVDYLCKLLTNNTFLLMIL